MANNLTQRRRGAKVWMSDMAMASQRDLKRMADALYNRHAKPLESEHWGKYIAVSASGETVVGADIADVRYRSLAQLGRGAFVFKIGEKAVGKLR